MKIYPYFKRLFDIVFSASALMLVFPICAIEYILVRIFISKDAIFVQKRGGLGEKTIKVYKFKTMKDACDENGKPLPDDQRMSKLGNILRKLSLDEFPQFYNVLIGDMSVIGPRPQPEIMIRRLPAQFKARSDVRPGITGLAQVNGRNDLVFSKKYSYDVEYVKTYSFWLDFKILCKTVLVVFKMEGSTIATEVKNLDDLGIWSCEELKEIDGDKNKKA